MKASNVREIREALRKINSLCGIGVVEVSSFEIGSICDAALAVPPRNCDVGTDIEQAKRFWRFCNERDCDECPLPSIKGGSCELFWGQMPYETEKEGDGNGSK